MQPVIAISIGDVGGIGPELVCKVFRDEGILEFCTPVVFAPRQIVEQCCQNYGVILPVNEARSKAEIRTDALNYVPLQVNCSDVPVGEPSPQAGEIGISAIASAVEWCMNGDADALVTAPVSKESIGMAGSSYRGHTEMLRDLTGSSDVLMVLASSELRVGLVTIHVPLLGVPKLVTRERIEKTLYMARTALIQDFGIANPRIAVLALNPHAGDGGYLGSEELTTIIPAIQSVKDAGIDADGPFAADAYFSAHMDSRHDMVVAMYHDQGLIPLKMSAHGRAVNITCGLPIVRTSPDHGTAFSIAGHGIADETSMREAVLQALMIIGHREAYKRTISI